MAKMDPPEMAKLVRESLLSKFDEFRMKPKPAQKGFHVVDPSDHGNIPFLSFFKGKARVDSLGGGVVVSAMGFGNLDAEISVATEAANDYASALIFEGFEAKVFSFAKKEPMINRGAYVFVSLLK